jgi:hypothetical protein
MSERPIYGKVPVIQCPTTPSEATAVIEYMKRFGEILTNLQSTKEKEVALDRLRILKQEAQITLVNSTK